MVVSAYSAALTPVVRSLGGNPALNPGESDAGSFAVQLLALGVVAVWAAASRDRAAFHVRAAWPYLLIVALCFASAFWSAFPFVTVRRSASLAVCVGYGLYLHDRLGLEGVVRLYLGTVLGLAALSVLTLLVLPGVGRDSALGYDDAMRGVFATKNAAGEALLLATACALALGARDGARRRRTAAGLALLLGALVLTRSATSAGVALLVTGLGVRGWLRSPQARLLHGALVAAAVLCALFAVAVMPDAVWAVLGRDASLTGRVPLWQESWALWERRPWFGYGYAAFWNADSPDVRYLWKIIGWNAPNAHNGYMDVLLQTGLAGLALYAVLWGRVAVRAASAGRRGEAWAGRAVLLVMVVNVLLNWGEGPLPYADEFTLLVAASLAELARGRTARPVPEAARGAFQPGCQPGCQPG